MPTFLDKIKNEPTIFCYSRVWRYAGHRRPFVILTVVLSALNQLVALLEPVVIAYLINTVQSQGVTDDNIRWLILVASSLLGITVLRWILHFPARIFERHNAFIVSKNYMLHLTKNILDLELKWHNDRESGDTIDKVNNATTSLRTFTSQNFRILRVVIGFTGSCIAIAFFNPYIALGTFICTGLIFYMLYSFDKKLIPQYKQLNIYKNRISASVFDVLSNVTTVVILGIKKLVNKDIEKRIDKPYKLYLKNINLMEVKWATGSISFEIVFTIGLIFFFLTLLVSDEVIAVGSIAAIILYLQRLGDTFFAFGGLYEDIIITKTDILNAEKIEADFKSKKAPRKVINFQENITLKNITFSYDDPEMPQLRDISLSINKGEKIALVGESGSGKTTLLKLIHGLYQNSSGTILADGEKVGTKLDRLNLETMLVPQEPELFSATVKENITLGTSITKENLERILEMSRFKDVVENLPRGLNSNINEKGVNLSGGQKQRLALARALSFSERKSIILLDESTSSVDPKNERQIYNNIFDAHKDKTIIASIHKFNLLDMFDRIIVFDHGRVVGDGRFKELLKSNNEFQTMKKSFEESL